MGDFNLPHTNLPHTDCTPNQNSSSGKKEMITITNNLLLELSLTQIIRKPTHMAGNILDLVFTNNTIIHGISFIPTLRSISHHCFLDIATSYVPSHIRQQTIPRVFSSPFDFLNYQSENASETHVPSRKIEQTNRNKIPREKMALMRRRTRINKQLKFNHHARKESRRINKVQSQIFPLLRKKVPKVKSTVGPLINENGNYISDSKKIADMQLTQYYRMFSTPKQYTNKQNQSPSKPSLRNLIWTKSFEEGTIPDTLTSAIITPKHKSGSKTKAENYHQIALTSHIIKVFERVVRNQIVSFMEENNLFNSSQHGFRGGRSCLSQLHHFDNILQILCNNPNADVVYLDFAKAFDKVDIDIALKKIENLGIKDKLLKRLKSFLKNRTQYVSVNGHHSGTTKVISGVPQGSVLGPLIFLILMGDINLSVKDASLPSFADDTRLTIKVSSESCIEKMQAT
ncbi:uncharacterized protein LOC130657750 [Hydractinia symbiolongicarpus]|uniref:uncharacterized protein LOC130657750 n=1 Tax=Hydractinia symbiolongicarpus TaxID=13093 RepID=UPI0025510535|nr:uncharacterized protein LOC130657750 [Hydractinia symbiolongicarpus]